MNTSWKWLLAASLSFNLGIIGVVLVKQAPLQAKARIPPPQLALADYLQLSDVQRQRWQQLEPVFLRDISANWSEIRQHRESLVHHIFSTTPDRALIDAKQARIAALQDAQQRRVIAQLMAERELLDERQRARLRDLLLSRYAQESTSEEQLHRD